LITGQFYGASNTARRRKQYVTPCGEALENIIGGLYELVNIFSYIFSFRLQKLPTCVHFFSHILMNPSYPQINGAATRATTFGL